MNPAKPSSRLKKAADVYKKLLSAWLYLGSAKLVS
jgi:hypothetical protein